MGPQNPTVRSNSYNIEIYQGPLLAPIHVMGVGGAYVASAEDTEGAAVNSASPAVRDPYSTSWFDYDVDLGISFPGAFASTDFDNHGDSAAPHAAASAFTALTVGGTLQFGGLGVAAIGDLQQFSLSNLTQTAPITMQVGRWKALGAYGLFGGQLVVGGGARIVTMQIQQSGAGNLLTMTGFGPEVGALLMPTGQRWRIGATGRMPVTGGIFGSENVTETGGLRKAGDFVLPGGVVQPWEIEAGLALQLGPRPINPGWGNPHDDEGELRGEIDRDRDKRSLRYGTELALLSPEGREARRREQAAEERALRSIEDEHLDEESQRLRKMRKARYTNWPREKILLLASVLMTGPSPGVAYSVEGFADQVNISPDRVGQVATFTPRMGMEGEPLQNRMLLRAGTYIEPSRYEAGSPRQHYTFGADVRLFPLTFWGLLPDADWKIGLFVDLAPRYQNAGIGIGNWH